jgi:hypothetical protein
MAYQSSDKFRNKKTGRVSDPGIEAVSLASLSASGPNSKGDGSMSTTLVNLPFDESKAIRFKEDAAEMEDAAS